MTNTQPALRLLPADTTLESAYALLAATSEEPSSIESILIMLADHTDDDDHLAVTLDWAMQLRALGMDWGNAIEAAMVIYFDHTLPSF